MSKPLFMPVVNVDTIPAGGLEVVFEATENERHELAQRLDLVSLDQFRGHIQVKPWRKQGVALRGHFEAKLVQSCVVTLDPVPARLDENFTAYFLPVEMLEPETPGSEREIMVNPDDDDPPEGFEDGVLSVGEALAEQLALALDPYPRKPGAALEAQPEIAGQTPEAKPNPFAVLEKFKKKD